MTRVGDLWTQLRAGNQPAAGWLARRLKAEGALAIYAAVRAPDRRQSILIEVGSAAMHGVRELPSASGFDFYPETIASGPRGSIRLCLVLADQAYTDIFELLADDIATFVSAANDERDAIARLIRRLLVWQGFLRHHSSGLSREEQEGLFGELLVVNWLSSNGIPLDTVLTSWRGPDGGLRDFHLGSAEFEVKTSTVGTGFEVGNFDQLDESSIGRLLLVSQVLRFAQSADSLPEMVQQLRERAGDTSCQTRQLTDERLLRAGYSDLHAASYGVNRWRLAERRFYDVKDAFPRITPADVRAGVIGVRYRVDLKACAAFEIEESEALQLVHI